MKSVLNKIFAMSLMALFLFAFFVAIAVATFIENDFGTPVAQKWVYKAFWFEFILGYLFLTLCYNLFRYKLFQWKKIGSLTFHVAFLVIVIGAWVTRLIGFEGAMQIREGGSSNIVISYDTYVQWKVHDLDQQYVDKLPVIFDGHTNNYFEESFNFPGENEPIKLEFVELKEQVKDTLIQTGASSGDPYIEIVTNGKKYNYLKSGEIFEDGGIKIAFNNTEYTDAISIFQTDSGMHVQTPFELTYFQMADQSEGIVARDSIQKFKTKRLYKFGDFQFVYTAFYKSAALELIESESISKDVKAVTVRATQGDLSQEVVLRGGKGMYPQYQKFEMGNLHYELAYGSELRMLPFYIYLDDFELERYPGTDQPSSYSSQVTLIDPRTDLEQKHHIYMNNVLDHDGYRFFQSSYDPDELGTVLSVNYDAPGTLISYIGYLLLTIGFVISLLTPHGRFRLLLRKSRETREKRIKMAKKLLLILAFGLSSQVNVVAQEGSASDNEIFSEFNGENPPIDADHAAKYGKLVMQNIRGRFEPVHTFATNLLRKVSRQTTYNDQSAMQVFLGIHTNSMAWNLEPFIYVSGKGLRKKLNMPEGESHASFVDFFSFDFKYLLIAEADEARRKKPSARSQYDKDVLKTDERVNFLFGVFTGAYLKIMPLPNDPAQNWYSPFDEENPFVNEDAEFMNSIVPLYNTMVNEAHESGDWSQADKVIDLIDAFQRKIADPNTIPSRELVDMEIQYNKFDIFKRLTNLYLLVGFILLILQFVVLYKPTLKLNWVNNVGFVIFILMAAAHGIGLGMRWYLTGHAPWSNGYEATVFIAFICAVAGLIFYRLSPIVLGATGVLVWLMLFVAHMNAMDPEMTQLVPVLKSYWLMIHVAVITGSYAFLGLGAILGLIILVMNLNVNKENQKRLMLTTKELTHVSEMTIMIGLFMLTVGTFLGGIWANESWGRYWGWDAKETWALASVVVYAMILHFRFIPGLKSQFAFNVASLWAYGSIIMTFFGVNYYLSGLHSYAAGDAIPIPAWVPLTVLLLLLLTIGSGLVVRSVRKSKTQKKVDAEVV